MAGAHEAWRGRLHRSDKADLALRNGADYRLSGGNDNPPLPIAQANKSNMK